MTNSEFVDILAVTVRLDSWPDDIQKRELHISVTRNAAGFPERMALDFTRRGHARFQILMCDPTVEAELRPLWVNRRMVRDGYRKGDACRLIEEFLHQYSAMPEPLQCAA